MGFRFGATAVVLLTWVVSAQAGLVYTGGDGTTFFGATQLSCPVEPGDPCSGSAQYVGNNITSRFDILSSAGNGWGFGNPGFGNHIVMSPNGGMGLGGTSQPAPSTFSHSGGTSGDGASFGSGSFTNHGSNFEFSLLDTAPGGTTASYMVASMESFYLVDGSGFSGTLGDYLFISGENTTPDSGSIAAMVSSWSVNGGTETFLPHLILAMSGTCAGDVGVGTSAVKINNACMPGAGGGFAGLATGVSDVVSLTPGDVLRFVTTLTVYADPSTIASFTPTAEQLAALGVAPDFAAVTVGNAGPEAPEPATYLLFGAGLLAVGCVRRRKS